MDMAVCECPTEITVNRFKLTIILKILIVTNMVQSS